MRLDAKMLDFGTPLAPSWGPNGAQNRPNGAKMSLKSSALVPKSDLWNCLVSKITFGAFLGIIFLDFRSTRFQMILGALGFSVLPGSRQKVGGFLHPGTAGHCKEEDIKM